MEIDEKLDAAIKYFINLASDEDFINRNIGETLLEAMDSSFRKTFPLRDLEYCEDECKEHAMTIIGTALGHDSEYAMLYLYKFLQRHERESFELNNLRYDPKYDDRYDD